MTITLSQQRIIIYGLGVSGLACARYFKAMNIDCVLMDSRETPPALNDIKENFAAFELVLGANENSVSFSDSDVLLVSPGIALSDAVVVKAMAMGARISSDIEYFVESINQPVIAITGSNGKSTVTKLVEQMLSAADVKAVACGNIGLPVMDLLLENAKYDVFVMELSSFQLERFAALNAKASCILNISEDHLDRYNGFAEYAASKQAVFNGADVAVVNLSDESSFCKAEAFHGERVYYATEKKPEAAVWLEKINDNADSDCELAIYDKQGLLIAASDLKIKGRHNLVNAMAALCLAQTVTDNKQALIGALKNFAGLSHRCQWVAEVNQVHYFNDSKATNVGATVAAIEGLASSAKAMYLIAGGQDKNSNFAELKAAVDQYVTTVFLFGQDKLKIQQSLSLDKTVLVNDLHEAVIASASAASAGDVVLFAPACASFDMFTNYTARGDAFVSEVNRLVA